MPSWRREWPTSERDPRRKSGTGEDRRGLPPRAGACAARFPGGAAGVLVRPPGRHHRAEYLGFVQPGPPGPAPRALLQARHRDGDSHARPGAGTAGVLLGEVQQPARAAQGRRDRGGERHLHRLLPTSTSAASSPDGSIGVNEVTYLILDVIDEMRLLQPSSNLQLSKKNPDRFLKRGLEIVRKGWGQPSIFNADMVVEELLRQGKSIEDARGGGTSGCVETGAFGKEAYILTGYFNLPKVLEITLNNGVDPRTGKSRSASRPATRAVFATYEELFAAFRRQLHHFIDIKMRGNQVIERLYAQYMPAPFLSLLVEDCIAKGRDYNDGGPRYNTTYIMGVAARRACTDSLSAIRYHVFDRGTLSMRRTARRAGRAISRATRRLRLRLWNKTPKYGNDDEYADGILRARVRRLLRRDQRPAEHEGRGVPGELSVHDLPRVLRVGRPGRRRTAGRRGTPLSDGISPVQGADRHGPTAVIKSAAKMDHARTGGTLLNQKFTPQLVEGENGIEQSGAPGALLLQARRASHSVQCGDGGDAARGAARAGEAPRPDRARGRVQRLLLRSDAGAAGGDHRADGADGVLMTTPEFHPASAPDYVPPALLAELQLSRLRNIVARALRPRAAVPVAHGRARSHAGRYPLAGRPRRVPLHDQDGPARHLSLRPVRQPDGGDRPAARLQRHHRQAHRGRLHPGRIVDVWTAVMVRSFAACGLHRGDIIQNAYGYGLFTGGLGAHYGAEALGATVIPISGGNTDRQIMVMKDFGVTAICCTPSYFLHLIERAAETGRRPSRTAAARRRLRRRALDRGHAPAHRERDRHQGLRHLRPLGDHRPGRGHRVPAPGRPAHLRGPLLSRDHRSRDRRGAAGWRRRANWC